MSFDERLQNERLDRLFEAIMTLESLEEFYRFFEDLCTVTELHTMAQRFYAAELLANGATYAEIADKTGMSSATISRIKRFLYYGAEGYRLAIDRLRQREAASEESEDDSRSRFE